MAQILWITRGLPASGKTTWAKETIKAYGNVTRINNDDLRAMMHDSAYTHQREKLVNAVTTLVACEAIRRGDHVIIDNTHLPERWVSRYRQLAAQEGVRFEVKDFRDVPLSVCLENNQNRPNPVPANVIHGMHNKFLRPEPIVQDETLQSAIIVDLDGTLALNVSGRSPYEWDRVGEDQANQQVVWFMDKWRWDDMPDPAEANAIILLSGRDSVCRRETEMWLHHNGILYDHLFMREAGDIRKDAIVKREIFDREIRHRYYVDLVLDDRQQVVDMWRDLGLKVWQVAEGNF